MQTAALQAEQTFITKLEIRLLNGPRTEPVPPVTLNVQTGLAELQDQGRWRVDLVIDVVPAEGHPAPPYEVSIAVSGLFRVISPMEAADARRLAFVNGLSILYSSARETVLLLTNRFPAGPFVLPTVSFVDEFDRLAPQQVTEPPAPYGEKK